MMKFHVTYDRTTPDSVDNGDYSESGFAYPHGGRCELKSDMWGKEAEKVKDANALSLRDALSTFESRGRGIEDNGDSEHSFYECDWSIIDYTTGEEERLALHCPDNITAASLARVRRLLGLD